MEVDGRCVLFDAGRHPDTVLRNAEALNVDLFCVTDVVLSHFHSDHNTGLIPILDDVRPKNPDAMRRIHVAQGFFLLRRRPTVTGYEERNAMIATRVPLEAAGVEFIEHSEAAEILPGVWVTGPVERNHPEKNYPQTMQVNMDGEWIEDYVPDSQGLTVVTAEGTADRLRAIGVQHLMAGHCTGVEPLFRLRTGLNLSRRTAVVGAVGSRFVYGEGIHPTAIAQ